jgi:hypothetical protein
VRQPTIRTSFAQKLKTNENLKRKMASGSGRQRTAFVMPPFVMPPFVMPPFVMPPVPILVHTGNGFYV